MLRILFGRRGHRSPRYNVPTVGKAQAASYLAEIARSW